MTTMNNTLPKGTSDEHYTPSFIFESLGLTFDLDPCSPGKDQSLVPAREHYTKKDDGLSKEWHGLVWMNPPYSAPRPWVEKFIAHGNGLALLPITRGSWWDGLWEYAQAVCPSTYNMKFVRPDGMPNRPIVFRTAIFSFGDTATTALKESGLGRVR